MNTEEVIEPISENEQDIENIDNLEKDNVVMSWLSKLNSWISINTEDESNIHAKLYSIKLFISSMRSWQLECIHERHPDYLQKSLSLINKPSNTMYELIDEFKKHFCLYVKLECDGLSLGGLDEVVYSTQFIKFVNDINRSIQGIPEICAYYETELNSETFVQYFNSISKNSQLTGDDDTPIYQSLLLYADENKEDILLFHTNIINAIDKIEALVGELMSVSENKQTRKNILDSLATLIVNRNNDNINQSIRDLDVLMKHHNKSFKPTQELLRGKIIKSSLDNILDEEINKLESNLTNPPKENIIRVIAEIVATQRKNITGQSNVDIRSFFLRMYQDESRFRYLDILLEEYIKHCVDQKDVLSNEIKSQINMYSYEKSKCASFINLTVANVSLKNA